MGDFGFVSFVGSGVGAVTDGDCVDIRVFFDNCDVLFGKCLFICMFFVVRRMLCMSIIVIGLKMFDDVSVGVRTFVVKFMMFLGVSMVNFFGVN